MYCPNCGAEINDKAVLCVHCGMSVVPIGAQQMQVMSEKWLVAFVLCFLVGFWGIHRLYTKNIHIGIAQLLLGLGACLGWIMCIVNMEGGGDDTSAIVSIICCIACGLVVGIWALVDSILLLMGKYVAGDGRILTKYTTTQTRR